MQPPEVGLLGLGLTGEVHLDLLSYIHLTPHASNELSRAGPMDAARASPASVWIAVSREQNDHPLAPHRARRTHYAERRHWLYMAPVWPMRGFSMTELTPPKVVRANNSRLFCRSAIPPTGSSADIASL